jgi:hypothetical protein
MCCVGSRRPVGGDDPDRLARADLAIYLPDDVEELRLHPGLFVQPPVPEQPVQLLEGVLVVIAVPLEGDGCGFLGVLVLDRDRAGVAIGDRVLCPLHAAQGRERPDSEAEDQARPKARRSAATGMCIRHS